MDGIKLGTTKAKALEKWGPAVCAVGTGGGETCAWHAKSATDFPVEGGVLELAGGKVCGMLIRAGSDSRSHELSITKLKKWKTEEGVGVGSTLKAAKKVLGKLVVAKRGVTTAFGSVFGAKSKKQVEEITIFKKGCNVT